MQYTVDSEGGKHGGPLICEVINLTFERLDIGKPFSCTRWKYLWSHLFFGTFRKKIGEDGLLELIASIGFSKGSIDGVGMTPEGQETLRFGHEGAGGWGMNNFQLVDFFCLGGTDFFFERVVRSWVWVYTLQKVVSEGEIPIFQGTVFWNMLICTDQRVVQQQRGGPLSPGDVDLPFLIPCKESWMWNLTSLQEYNYYLTISNLSRFYHQIPVSYISRLFCIFQGATCSFFGNIQTHIHDIYNYIHTSILASLPPPKGSPHWLGFAKVHDVYIRCQLARDQQQPDTLQMLGAIESRLLVKFHVVGRLGRVGEGWHWSINMEISQLNGAQQKNCWDRAGIKFWRVVSSKIRVLQVWKRRIIDL